MENKIFTVAIIGVGARGVDAYGWQLYDAKNKFKIVALCDINPVRLAYGGEKFDVPAENRFATEEEFFKEKRADLLLVTTQDKDHIRHCVKGFELGYDIMTEKPLTDKKEECQILLDAQKKAGKKALVCHVLRYAPAFLKAMEAIESGKIGKLVAIDALERVGYWHQAHSYVRGNWRTTEQPCGSAPMILAKCCHDLDLLQWYAKSKCKSISSVGDLVFFKAENAPEGATERCVNCPHRQTCPYSAENVYIAAWKKRGCPVDIWPFNVLVQPPINEEKLRQAITEGAYGRCVFYCDNNVVDHQLTTMTFENGVKATLTMTGFTAPGGRRYTFHGTMGELVLDEMENSIRLYPYGKDPENTEINALEDSGYGHGGGDVFLVRKLYEVLCGNAEADTSLEASVESHLMGIYAEESRLKGGELIYIHK
jgi:predicted dehydrogenase